MEAYLLENPAVLTMETDGFDDVEILQSEMTLIAGRSDKNTDGRIDILARYGQEYLAIVELKLGELTHTHLTQLESYLKERQQILENAPHIWDSTLGDQPKWVGVMVGSTIHPELLLRIRLGYFFDADIPIAALTINRFKGKDANVYVVTDTHFSKKVKNRNYSKGI